jgi:hypothetical protein
MSKMCVKKCKILWLTLTLDLKVFMVFVNSDRFYD